MAITLHQVYMTLGYDLAKLHFTSLDPHLALYGILWW